MPKANSLQIAKYMEEIGLDQVRDFAIFAGISRTTIYRALSGGVLSNETLNKFAVAFSRKLKSPIYPSELIEDTPLVDSLRQDLTESLSELNSPVIDKDGLAQDSHSEHEKIIDNGQLQGAAQAIPDQNALIRFGISQEGRLRLVPTLVDENDYETIETLRAELLADEGSINTLKERYTQNQNLPQAGLFGAILDGYFSELMKDTREINYAVLYARGARFYAARATANRQVSSGEWPEPDADEAEAIDNICNLHGPLIMASAVGRKLIADAHEYEATPEIYRQEEELVQEFGRVITTEEGLMEDDSAQALSDLIDPVEDDPQPARTRGVRLLVAGSALVTIVGSVAWLGAGCGALAVALPLVVTYGAGMFAWEVAKKTEGFKKTTSDLASRYDEATRRVAEEAGRQQIALLEKLRRLVDRNRDLFGRVSGLRPEFSWARRYIERAEERLPRSVGEHIDLTDMWDVVIASHRTVRNYARDQAVRLTLGPSPKFRFVYGLAADVERAIGELLIFVITKAQLGGTVVITDPEVSMVRERYAAVRIDGDFSEGKHKRRYPAWPIDRNSVRFQDGRVDEHVKLASIRHTMAKCGGNLVEISTDNLPTGYMLEFRLYEKDEQAGV